MRAGPARGLAIALVALFGCATTGAAGTTARSRERESVRFEAQDAYAAAYDTRTPSGSAATGPHASAIEAATARATSTRDGQLRPDPRLASLAGWALAYQRARGATPPHAAIDLWTHHLGLVEPAPHLLVLGISDPAALEARVAAEIEAMLGAHRYTHWGAATSADAGSHLVVVALAWRWVELERVPRVLRAGDTVRLRGRLDAGLAEPELAVTPPRGATWRKGPGTAPAFDLAATLGKKGTYRVELLAHGEQGPTVVANFPVSVGVEPETAVVVEVGGEAPTSAEAMSTLVELINRDRRRAGLAPLAHDAALADVARAHSQDMRENGFVAHTSPTTGSAADRVARGGIRTRLVLENIGQGYGPEEVHAGLMGSPGHRASVLSPDATHVGIGLVTGSEDGHTLYLVTELFIRRAAPIDTDEAPEALLELVNAKRAARRLPPLVLDEALSEVCARAARDFFAKKLSHEALAVRAGSEAKALRPPYSSLGAVFVVVDALDEAATLDGFLDPKATGIGLGVAQGTRKDTEPHAIAVVAVLGR